MKASIKTAFIIPLILFTFKGSVAQNEKDVTPNVWLEFGSLKFAPTKKESSAGIDIAFKYQQNKLLTNLQYHDYFDRELAHGGLGLFTNSNHYHAGNFLIGVTNSKCRYGHVSISSGLGIFWGYFDEISKEKFTTLAWPVEAAASLNLFPFLGINVKLFTNINTKHSLIGFGFDIQLGKLRPFYVKKIVLN